jgi:hypothetical protein
MVYGLRTGRSCASALSMPGIEIFSSTSMPKPLGICPIPKVPSMATSFGNAIFSRALTYFSAPMKHALYPAANSCSGFVPSPPPPPSSLGRVSLGSRLLSGTVARSSRPPVTCA